MSGGHRDRTQQGFRGLGNTQENLTNFGSLFLPDAKTYENSKHTGLELEVPSTDLAKKIGRIYSHQGMVQPRNWPPSPCSPLLKKTAKCSRSDFVTNVME